MRAHKALEPARTFWLTWRRSSRSAKHDQCAAYPPSPSMSFHWEACGLLPWHIVEISIGSSFRMVIASSSCNGQPHHEEHPSLLPCNFSHCPCAGQRESSGGALSLGAANQPSEWHQRLERGSWSKVAPNGIEGELLACWLASNHDSTPLLPKNWFSFLSWILVLYILGHIGALEGRLIGFDLDPRFLMPEDYGLLLFQHICLAGGGDAREHILNGFVIDSEGKMSLRERAASEEHEERCRLQLQWCGLWSQAVFRNLSS